MDAALYSPRMKTTLKLIVASLGAAVALWWMRLAAHSKAPAPEGRWHEVDENELQP